MREGKKERRERTERECRREKGEEIKWRRENGEMRERDTQKDRQTPKK